MYEKEHCGMFFSSDQMKTLKDVFIDHCNMDCDLNEEGNYILDIVKKKYFKHVTYFVMYK